MAVHKEEGLKIYKDRDLTQPVIDLEFGILPAGETKRYTFYVSNQTPAMFKELKFEVEHSEIEIVKAPTDMISQSLAEIIFKWSPTVTLKEGLRASLHIQGKSLWG